MQEIEVQFIGSGDAFGSGGRFQTCIGVSWSDERFLIDCGASSLIALRRLEINPRGVSKILVTHLHGDHFGGIPFFVLDAQLISKRSSPLTLIGPPNYRTIVENRDRLTCKRIILTHMSEDVLSRGDEIELPMAEDGVCIVI